MTWRETASYNVGKSEEEGNRLEAIDYARKAVDVADDMQATDIVLLDIREVSSFTDFFVVMSAESPRQMDALAQNMQGELKEAGAALHHREGGLESGWLLLDFGDVIVHVFAPEERAHYQLEAFWSKGKQVVTIQ